MEEAWRISYILPCSMSINIISMVVPYKSIPIIIFTIPTFTDVYPTVIIKFLKIYTKGNRNFVPEQFVVLIYNKSFLLSAVLHINKKRIVWNIFGGIFSSTLSQLYCYSRVVAVTHSKWFSNNKTFFENKKNFHKTTIKLLQNIVIDVLAQH